MRVVLSTVARRHARSAALAYADRAPGTIEGFQIRFEEAITQLSDFPESGQRVSGTGYLRLSLQPYPYSLVYQLRGRNVRILAVPHDHQSRTSWFRSR